MEEKSFDGIILPVPYRRMGNSGMGSILGITMTSLETAPLILKLILQSLKQNQ